MQEIRLTPTSYIVLGLLELAGESTPYGLKQLVAGLVGPFLAPHHAPLYSEPERLPPGGPPPPGRPRRGGRRDARVGRPPLLTATTKGPPGWFLREEGRLKTLKA